MTHEKDSIERRTNLVLSPMQPNARSEILGSIAFLAMLGIAIFFFAFL
jgi:hypothetical protein